MNKIHVNPKILYISELSVLIALILLMAFTPIGYIKTGGLEITLLTIPVIIGAIILGPKAGAILGTIFGITSFLQAVLALSQFGILMLEVSPVYCFITCVPTRMFMGLLTGLIYKAFKEDTVVSHSITGLAGAIMNTVFFMTALIACYWDADFIQGLVDAFGSTSVLAFAITFVGINGLIEAIACFIISAAITKTLSEVLKKVGSE